MKTDCQLQKDVTHELRWEPAALGMDVKLSGMGVRTDAEQFI